MHVPATRTVVGVLLADARRHRLVTLATLIGVAVGIAVVVGIRLASEAALDQFARTHGAIAGEATHEVVGTGPLDAARLLAFDGHPSVRAVHPVVDAGLLVPEGPDGAPLTLRLLGVDPFLSGPFLPLGGGDAPDADPAERAAWGTLLERLMIEPDLAIAARGDLLALGLPAGGGTLAVRGPRGPLALRLEPMPGSRDDERGAVPLAIADLATAQEAVGLDAEVSRFELILARSERGVIGDATEAAVPLAPGERLERAGRRGERADTMTRAFRSNLLALGFLAVLVGAFLVFNMVQFAVTRRRPIFGRLRCLGCPARAVLVATLAEAALLGLVGGLLGLVLGRGLASAMAPDIARTVSTLYGAIEVPAPSLDAATVLGALGIAVASAVLASWAPARSAARTPPVLVATGTVREPPISPALPVVCLVLAGLALLPPASPVALPAASVLLILLAVATSCPLVLGLVARRLARRAARGVSSLALAAGRIERSLTRTGAAAGALVMPVAMTMAIAVMVGSFEREVVRWIEGSLGADLYMKPRWAELAPATMPPGLAGFAASLDGVRAVDTLRQREATRARGSFVVVGTPLASVRLTGSLRVTEGGAIDEILAAYDEGAALVSEPLATRRDLHPGSTLAIDTPDGPVALEVAAIFQDFSYDRGLVMLDDATYARLFGEAPLRGVALLLEEDADAGALAEAIAARYPDVEVTPVRELRRDVLVAFERTFAMTFVLQAISTALAWVGVLTGLLCLHLERRAELGVLRALGTTTARLRDLLVTEALLLVGVALVLAVPTGLVLAGILIDVVNVRSFGWSFPMDLPLGELASVAALTVGAGLLAGLVPWALARRVAIARLLEART